MKLKKLFIVLLCGVTTVGLMACGSSNDISSSNGEEVSAEETTEDTVYEGDTEDTAYEGDGEALYTGVSGTVTWTIYDDGVLYFEPTSGKKGTFDSYENSSDVPWCTYSDYIVTVQSSGKLSAGEALNSFFAGCEYLTDVGAIASWDVSDTTSFRDLFYNCKSLVEIDLSDWNTSNVTNMRSVFYCCTALETINIEGWDMSAVETKTDRYYMFYGTTSLKSITLGEDWTWSASNNESFSGSLPNSKSWTKEGGDGTVYTSEDLATQWTSDFAGTWVLAE